MLIPIHRKHSGGIALAPRTLPEVVGAGVVPNPGPVSGPVPNVGVGGVYVAVGGVNVVGGVYVVGDVYPELVGLIVGGV